MATYTYFRSVNFTTDSTDYDLFTNTNVRNALKERFAITEESVLDEKIAEGIRQMYFQVYVSGTTVTINDGIAQVPIGDELVSSGDYVREGIKSIKIAGTGITGQFRFNTL